MAAEKQANEGTFIINISEAVYLKGKLNGLDAKKMELTEEGKTVTAKIQITCTPEFLAGIMNALSQIVPDANILQNGRKYSTMWEILSKHKDSKCNQDKNQNWWTLETINPVVFELETYHAVNRDIVDGYRYINKMILGNPDRAIMDDEDASIIEGIDGGGNGNAFIVGIKYNNTLQDPTKLYNDWTVKDLSNTK